MLVKVYTVATFAALAALNFSTLAAQVWVRSANQEATRHRERIQALTALEKAMVDAETGQRGFIITRQQSFLEPYHAGKRLAPIYLQRLTKGIPDKLPRLIESKFAGMSQTISASPSEARSLIASGEGKQIMDEIRVTLAQLAKKEQSELEWDIERYGKMRDASTWLLATAIAANVGAIAFYFWRNRDIQQQAEKLKTAVDCKTCELVEANARLTSLNELKRQFIRTISHEYRTPLTIISSASMLLQQQSKAPPEKRERWFKQIDDAVKRLDSLLRDVMSIESEQEYSPRQLDLVGLLLQIIEEQPGSERVQLSVHATATTGLFDEQAIRETIGNLLGNALKYSNEQVILLVIGMPGSVAIEVRDRGRGIPQKDIPRLFEDFSRGSNVEQVQGTGLGLAIASRAARRCGGTITVQSTEGEGSVFRVTLPWQ